MLVSHLWGIPFQHSTFSVFSFFFLHLISWFILIGASSVGRHTFKSTSFTIPKSCDYCRGNLWGLSSKQGLTCIECGYNCHPKCELKVPPDCPHKLSTSPRDKMRNTTTATTSVCQSSTDTATIRPSSMAGDSRSIYARVLYSYDASSDPNGPHDHQELSIRQGDTLMILSQDDGSGWALAQSNTGISGWIPANYVELLPTSTTATTSSELANKSTIATTTTSSPSIAVSSLSSHSSKIPPMMTSSSAGSTTASRFTKVRALYDYEAQSHLELTIRKGDLIELIRTDIPDSEGWWEGKLGSRLGQFPANYVQPFHS